MKKKLAVLLLLAAIAVLIANLTAGKQSLYSELCITQDEMQEIIRNREGALDSLYTKILFNDYELAYDAAGNRLFYSLIENGSNAYDPYVECISEKIGVQIAVVGSEITEEAIAGGEEYQILVYTEKEYQLVNLAFTTLPLLSVDFEGELGDTDVRQMRLKLFDNRQDATRRVVNSDGEISVRGRNSRIYPKQGYRITLYTNSVGDNRREQNISLLGMRKDADWHLYAAYNDQEKIRNVFSANLWKESCAAHNVCGLDNGMEYRYVELFVKGEYWGLYALGYPIDALQLQMTDGEYMYNKINPYRSELDIDFNLPGVVDGYEIKEMGTNSFEDWEPLKEYYRAMLYSEGDYSELREMVDMGNCIDIFLFINMIQGVDHANLRGYNIVFNLYMTNKFLSDGESEIMLYTPWDMDRSWGNGYGDVAYNVAVDQNVLMETNIVYLLLEQGDEEIKQMLVQRYLELREGAWSDEHLLELIAGYEDQIFHSGAYARDKARWPEGKYVEEQQKMELFRNYVLERMQYMDAFVGRD